MNKKSHNIFAVILAAGASKRFGANKQVSLFGGESLVQRATNTARKVCGEITCLVTGHDWHDVLVAAGADSPFFVVNEKYHLGIGSSIAMAAKACQSRADAMLLLLCDQPLVSAAHLQTLIDRWSGDDHEIVASAYSGTFGPPVLFPRATFGDLLELTGDQGARALLRDSRFKLRTVPFADAAIDIDTISDLDLLRDAAASQQ